MKNTAIFSIRKITLIALLSTLAYVGRILFAWIPNVQPVTVILLIITLEIGLVEGILTASLSMFLSNIFLGMGPWTLHQIASFAIVILVFSCLKPLSRQTWKQPLLKLAFFTIMAGLMGYLYGFVISIFLCISIIFLNFGYIIYKDCPLIHYMLWEIWAFGLSYHHYCHVLFKSIKLNSNNTKRRLIPFNLLFLISIGGQQPQVLFLRNSLCRLTVNSSGTGSCPPKING